MAYDKTVWVKNDLITAEKLNKIEDGISNANDGLDNFTESIAGDLLYKGETIVPQFKTVNGSAIVGEGNIATLALGETSADAYRGDKGKTAYDKSVSNETNISNILNGTAPVEHANQIQATFFDSMTDINIPLISNSQGDGYQALFIDKQYQLTYNPATNVLKVPHVESDVYTETEANELLSFKADKATTYTKTEIDTIVGDIETLLGAI